MADVNAPVEQAPALAPPTRTDEQILPRIRWVPIGKSNCYLDAEKSQSNPIYKIAVDILKHTNFFRAFTASSTIPAIYIQQFWDTICYDRTDGGYKCQLDDQWFNLTKDTLRDALQIMPVNNNKAFLSPPTQDTLINFVNSLGYLKEVKHLSNVVTNDMFQPWKALTTIINCALQERLLGLKGKELQCCRFFGALSIELISIMRKGCGKNSLNPSTPSRKTRRIWHNTLWERRKPLSFAKGTKREVFGMPIPNELITDDIRGADYYNAYLKKVAKHHKYLVGEEVSDPDSPAPKPAKSTKPKITKQTKPVAPKAATKKPQPAPTKPKEKKRKQDKETTEATPPAKRTKAGKVAKKRTLKRSQQLVDEVVDEGIPLTEPGFGDLEADTEIDTRKYQPLPEVEGKEKEKVSAEQAARVLLNLQTPKKKSPTEQYIFQRCTSAPTEPSSHDESSSLYVELGLTESDTESDEEVPLVVKSSAPDEGHAGPNSGIQDEGQARPNPGNDIVSQTLSTPGVHAGPNLEHTDAEATDATSQPQPGQMDEEFTATAYPNIQENLKLTVDDPVIPEEPASSTGTLSSLQHLAKDFSFGDQFFNDKPSEANNEKTTADTEAESMVSVTIHQDTSVIPPMTSPVIDLVSVPDSPIVHRTLPTTTAATATTTTTTILTTIPLPPQPQQVSSDSILLNRLGELEQHIADLVDANQALEERLDKHGSRLYRLENQDIPNQVSKAVDEIVTDAVDWAMHAPLRERFRDLKSSQQLVDEFVDEGIPLTEPGFGDLEADTQRAIEESLKDAHGAHRGPLPPVVFRETDTGKFQPLPEVEGKGKEKVGAEQAARVLLNLQTPKKKSPTEQYIFQRRTSAPTEPSGHDESSSLYAELGLTESDTESDEEVPPVVKSGAPDEGQAGPNPGIQDEGQAGPNPGNDTVSQTLSTPGVHAGPNLEHTDAEATDATSQPQPGQMDEEFTATAYPNIQENLKLTVDDPVIPEEPASSTGTLSSLQHLAKDFSFGDQFFNDKPPEANNEKATTDT
ncbi:hypothetical protein Tco_0867414 [Tanacetum coccineum]